MRRFYDARYGRVLYLQDYASYIKDSFVSELCDLDRDLMLSIDILPVPTDEAARQLQSTLLGVETNVANWQRRQNANNNFTATIPYDMELQRKETKEMLDDLTTRDQRMMFGLVTLVHLADNKEQLDSDTETLYSTARKNVDELLRSDTARLMLANSEFLVMLNQSATDRAELAKLLNISDNQLGYVTNVPAGCGLIRCAGNIVPFTNSFPKDTKLYKLMSTNPSEKRE